MKHSGIAVHTLEHLQMNKEDSKYDQGNLSKPGHDIKYTVCGLILKVIKNHDIKLGGLPRGHGTTKVRITEAS